MNNKNRKTESAYQERLYIVNVLEMNVVLYPNEIGQTKTRENLKSSIVKKIEGKCTEEGYIRPGSVEVKQYSAGIVKGDMVEFTVVFQCYSSNPVEGTIIECVVKSITKAGIHAEARDHLGNVPVTVFIARDHFVEKKAFQEVTETSLEKKVFVKVIGSRFELNDDCVEVLGELIQMENNINKK
jgi:DNA-directed RNA polymerase subunit E'/Rpb7